jgi:hypothetical protein
VIKKIFLFILVILTYSQVTYSQGWLTDENNFETNWNLTFQIGPTLLVSELKKDLSGASNDMSSQTDFGFGFQLAKMVWERVDIGLDLGLANYKGYRNNPSNINYLMLSGLFHNKDIDFQPYPIYYKSNIANFTLYTKYNFINFSSFTKGFIKLNLYTKIGIGIIFISSEMGYQNNSNYLLTGLIHPLFAVGRYTSPVRNAHFSFNPSFGMNYQLSDRFFISGEASFQLINADYVDGIPNYNDKLSPEVNQNALNEYRVPVFDLTGKFMLGITYFFNFDSHRQTREKAFPWYFNRYRSYYSKFQNPSTKKARQERLPFYNIKFEE